MKKITFIVGGGRCGKSRQALAMALKYTGTRIFIATAEPMDDEMKARIDVHRQERDLSFVTLEEPLHLGHALAAVPESTQVAVIDCLTVWLGNLMHHLSDETDMDKKIDHFLHALKTPPCDLVIVSNEVGMGIIPENAVARQFRDLAGRLNQQVAACAHNVILMVSGIAVPIKEEKI